MSTLGNRNVASELLAVCGATAGLLLCVEDATRRDRVLAFVTLALCGLAIFFNASRSGLFALPLGCAPCLWFVRRYLVVGALILGLGLPLGFAVCGVSLTSPATTSEVPNAATPIYPAPSTIEVRKELWLGTLSMIGDQPVTGYGGGQFQIEYPPYRRVREIELSSFGRRFVTAPKTAHNDYLQILADLGLIGFLLAALAAWLMLRRVPLRFTGPLLAFLVLAGVRSPLGNAPTAAAVFLFAGTLVPAPSRSNPRVRPGHARPTDRIARLGLFFIWFGGGQLLSQMAATDYVRQMKSKEDWSQAIASVERALLFRPYDHDMRIQRLKDRLKTQSELPAAREDLEYLLRIAPGLPSVQVHHAELLNAEGEPDAARTVLNLVRARDIENQRAIQVMVLILVRQREVPTAILTLYRSKHERTRESLAAVLGGLSGQAKDEAGRSLLLSEQAFVQSLDQFAAHFEEKEKRTEIQRVGDLMRIQKTVNRFSTLQRSVPGTQTDRRAIILMAILQLERGSREGAESTAPLARRRSLLPTHAAMMKDILERLRTLPSWRELLGDR